MGFGHWETVGSLPAFAYTADQDAYEPATWDPIMVPPTNRHWTHVGNQRITLVTDNAGLSGLWDSHDGYLWITEPRPTGTGIGRLVEGGTVVASTSYHERGALPRRWIGPTFARVTVPGDGVELERTVLCPSGEEPWVLVRVDVRADRPRRLTLVEEWAVRPAVVDIRVPGRAPVALDEAAVVPVEHGIEAGPLPPGTPCAGSSIRLDRVDGGPVRARAQDFTLALEVDLDLAAGEEQVVFFRFGLATGQPVPADCYDRSLREVAAWLPRAVAYQAPEAAEISWHAALLAGGACTDGVLGGHTLDQGSVYAFGAGFNGAARDPLQHALPMVYVKPELALSVLCNTCAWGSPDGDLPYALDGRKQPWTDFFRPSDQNLWALWLAAEYAAVTGDLAAFAEPVGHHPRHETEPVPLGEHLRRQFEFLTTSVGLGEHGHLRILNADWNDLALAESGADRALMIDKGESVLNSAMAAWVLPVYAGLADRLGQHDTATKARDLAGRLREAVAGEWNGRWFRRAYAPGADPVGEHDLWLEVQPWAILCGAATADQAVQLLDTIDQTVRPDSPLGARIRWPVGGASEDLAMRGSIWFAVNATLVWAAARIDPALAWDEWRRMTLTAHTAAYPDVWEGTLSGPDSYLAPELPRAGRTWSLPAIGLAMQAYPVSNLHSHAQPLLAYLRVLGIEPGTGGELRTGAGASFHSSVLTLNPDGSGLLRAKGDVTVRPSTGPTITGSGTVTW
jgi:hypothetical protein